MSAEAHDPLQTARTTGRGLPPIRGAAVALAALVVTACGDSGCDDYPAWSEFEGTDGRYTLMYLTPPWTICSGSEYEAACRECPAARIGAHLCGAAGIWDSLWIEPFLLDPDFLLIPSYKIEVTSFTTGSSSYELALSEQQVMAAAGLEVVRESHPVTLHDGSEAHEVHYRGMVYVAISGEEDERPDVRDWRVLYFASAGSAYRVALDTAIDPDLPEVDDMLRSFSVSGAGDEP